MIIFTHTFSWHDFGLGVGVIHCEWCEDLALEFWLTIGPLTLGLDYSKE